MIENNSTKQQSLRLVVSISEAKNSIDAQIEKGNSIIASNINSIKELYDRRDEYERWSDYNKSLLLKLFSDKSILGEYFNYVGGSVSSRFDSSLSEDVADFKDEVKTKINKLTSINERLDLFQINVEKISDIDLLLVTRLCERIAYSAKILSNRQRKDKLPYKITDEYDIQDLLHSIIRAYLKYSVQEDPISKVAGIRGSRADISIEDLGLLIEVKYVHNPNDDKRIFDDISKDLILYTAWTPLKSLLFLIYNSSELKDPEALTKLNGENEINGKRFTSKIILS